VSDGGEDQGAEEALWGKRRKNYHVSFGNSHTRPFYDSRPQTWNHEKAYIWFWGFDCVMPIERCSDGVVETTELRKR